MRQVNRIVWGVSGVATALVLAIPGSKILTRGNLGDPTQMGPGVSASPVATIPGAPGLVVDSCGANVRITAGPVHQIRVTAQGNYPPGQGITPAVPWSRSGQQVTVGDSGCDGQFSPNVFSVTVPDKTTVTVDSQSGYVDVTGTGTTTVDSGGGNVNVSGTGVTTVDSNSGYVTAADIDGTLTVDSGGGNVNVNGLTGTLDTDTGSGFLNASGLKTAQMDASTDGGNARVVFDSPPRNVILSTDSGDATLDVPGGPYSLSATTDSGSWNVQIPTNPQASQTLTVTTDGGNLEIAG
jgi:hypothetical protein